MMTPVQAVGARIHPMLQTAPLAAIAAEVGTPAYVYSAPAIRTAYRELDAALAEWPHAIHYALKANSSLGIVRLLRELGAGADANSVGEIEVALRAGFVPSQIIFTGVGKRPDELDRAVGLGIKAINAESAGELDRIAEVARAHRTTARVALRVNPDIDAGSHPHISTGRRINKFGVPIEQARTIYRDVARQPGLRPVGVHVHVGSQITSLDPLTRAAATVVAFAKELRADGVPIEYLDLGGGLGISYDEAEVPGRAEYARALAAEAAGAGFALVLEPGRAIVGSAGLLLTRVLDVKEYPDGPRFAVLDAAMTELMRPALYGAYHRVVPVEPRPGERRPYDVVGPVCESSDVFGRDRLLPPLEPGDLLAILDTGAYSAAMGSTYNRRPLPPEVLVDDTGWTVIRRRQTIEDLVSLED
jgi:diaminopimelate decarboxylase